MFFTIVCEDPRCLEEIDREGESEGGREGGREGRGRLVSELEFVTEAETPTPSIMLGKNERVGVESECISEQASVFVVCQS